MATVPCDPGSIVKNSACFQCVPKKTSLAIKAYLLCQTAIVADPTAPCVAPSAAVILPSSGPPAGTLGNTSISLLWRQPPSPGSFVRGYIISWGTTSGGPYTFSSTRKSLPRQFLVTGLTPGMTYFFVIQTIGPSPSCLSANSAEFKSTTTGATPNGLLNNLVHFYQFQDATAMFADSGSDPISLNFTNAGAGFSRVAGHVQAFAGNYADPSGPNDIGTIAAAPFDFTGDGSGNTPMTWCVWLRLNGASGGQPATLTFVSVWTPVFYFAWVNTNALQFNMQNAGGATITCSSPFVYDNNWHLLVGGFDKTNGVIFLSVDNGAKITQAVAQAKSVNSTSFNIGNCSACGGNNGNWSFSDVGVWNARAFLASDISNLWNSGAGLPFSHFTN